MVALHYKVMGIIHRSPPESIYDIITQGHDKHTYKKINKYLKEAQVPMISNFTLPVITRENCETIVKSVLLDYCFTLDDTNVRKVLYAVVSSCWRDWFQDHHPKLYEILFDLTDTTDICVEYENMVLWLDNIEDTMRSLNTQY